MIQSQRQARNESIGPHCSQSLKKKKFLGVTRLPIALPNLRKSDDKHQLSTQHSEKYHNIIQQWLVVGILWTPLPERPPFSFARFFDNNLADLFRKSHTPVQMLNKNFFIPFFFTDITFSDFFYPSYPYFFPLKLKIRSLRRLNKI